MMKTSRKILFLALTLGLLLGTTPALHASSIYEFTVDHCGGGCAPAGTVFGTVTLTDAGTSVDVAVHLNSGFRFAKTGAADFQAFKFNGTGIVLGDITIDAHVPNLTASTGSFNGDGTGAFTFGIGCGTCGNGLSDPFVTDILFHVANAEIADLTGANDLGFVFVADIGNANGNTGPVAALPIDDEITITTRVPEPASVGLLGLGLLGIGLVARKKSASVYQK
jgi:hypothetical protein